MDILRIAVRWSAFEGGPGYSNFHFGVGTGWFDGGLLGDSQEADVENAAGRVRAAFSALGAIIPTGVQLAIESEAEILDSDTGEILGAVPVEVDEITAPRGSGGYSGASGGVVNWRTSDYRFGRRIRGRTFIVPLAGAAYEANGTLTPNALGSLRDFGATIIAPGTGPDFGVWSRPRNGAGGVFATATSATVPDMAAILRSRRD